MILVSFSSALNMLSDQAKTKEFLHEKTSKINHASVFRPLGIDRCIYFKGYIFSLFYPIKCYCSFRLLLVILENNKETPEK